MIRSVGASPRVRLVVLWDQDSIRSQWPVLASSFGEDSETVDVEWHKGWPTQDLKSVSAMLNSPDGSPYIVLASGAAARHAYQASKSAFSHASKLVLVDPCPPPRKAPDQSKSGIPLTVMGTWRAEPSNADHLLAWRRFSGSQFEVRFLPALSGPLRMASLQTHIADTLGFWWMKEGGC